MGDIPLHAAIVHIPLGVAVVVPLFAIALSAALARGLVDRRAWVVVVALQAVVVVGGFAAMNTGHTEEETVERVVAKKPIHEHEERGEAFVYAATVTLALAASAFFVGPQRIAMIAGATALATVVNVVLAVRAGQAGGELVFKHGAASAYATPASE
jgi:hypothetical protein